MPPVVIYNSMCMRTHVLVQYPHEHTLDGHHNTTSIQSIMHRHIAMVTPSIHIIFVYQTHLYID